MNKGINLLGTNSTGVTSRVGRRLLTLRVIAIGILFLVSISSVVLLLLIALSPLPQLRQQEASEIQQLSSYQTAIAQLAMLRERTDSITHLIHSRPDYAATMQNIEDLVPQDVTITGLSLKGKTASVTVASTSLLPINTFITSLVSMAQKKKDFSNVLLNNLSMDTQTNRFSLTVALQLL